ncbi:hypothetical protein [Mycobacteroides abscessus]|uniref:hypothetical protein n=2 Tax=Mycobacteroides abscessus TaxID=36809 RepID=UPI0012AAE806|nr:hypothetical protein [Mycobacteroides abscessus]
MWVWAISWACVLVLCLGLAIYGMVLTTKSQNAGKEHQTQIGAGKWSLRSTSSGISLAVIGVVGAITLLGVFFSIRPDNPKPTADSGSLVVQTQTVTVTPSVRPTAPTGTPSPPATTAAATQTSSGVQPADSASCVGTSGPWSGDLNGLQIIVSEVQAPRSVPGQLTFKFRIENHSTDMVRLDDTKVLVVDSNQKQYGITNDGFDWYWAVSKGEVRPGTMTLATPLQGSPTSVELRFNIDQSLNQYETLPICVPVPA